jgi:predicted nucleic acid-binding protein
MAIDASVAIKWMLNDDPKEYDVDRAESILALLTQGVVQAYQPLHWNAEVLSVVAHKAPEKIELACALLFKATVKTVDSLETYRKAAGLAAALKHHLFDTLYHVVALECGATLITADDAYFAKAFRLYPDSVNSREFPCAERRHEFLSRNDSRWISQC